MVKKIAYNIKYRPRFYDLLKTIDKQYFSLIKEQIYEQLSYEPLKETRNRKPLTKPTWIGENVWELRFGPDNIFRVFYEVIESDFRVNILAIGIKKRNKLYFGRKAVQL